MGGEFWEWNWWYSTTRQERLVASFAVLFWNANPGTWFLETLGWVGFPDMAGILGWRWPNLCVAVDRSYHQLTPLVAIALMTSMSHTCSHDTPHPTGSQGRCPGGFGVERLEASALRSLAAAFAPGLKENLELPSPFDLEGCARVVDHVEHVELRGIQRGRSRARQTPGAPGLLGRSGVFVASAKGHPENEQTKDCGGLLSRWNCYSRNTFLV